MQVQRKKGQPRSDNKTGMKHQPLVASSKVQSAVSKEELGSQVAMSTCNSFEQNR